MFLCIEAGAYTQLPQNLGDGIDIFQSRHFVKDTLFFASLASASEVVVREDRSGIAEDAVSTLIHNASIFIPMEELVDIEKEIARLEKEEKRLAGEIKRAKGMLSNEKFVKNAPQAKVEEEKAKLEKYKATLAGVEERLNHLTS